ncbi:MAG TPA: sugar ABC transporter permease [Clostridia bacterium]|nr:sugar ABC transporter permease [Clostridia bacterium]
MARARAAIFFAVLFLVLFFLSGITASMTVEETTATARQSLGAVLFSLSSVSVLLLPLSLVTMLLALVGMLHRQRSVGMLFAGVATACMGLFLVLYAAENLNGSLYTLLGDEMKALGVKFKKRDVTGIDVRYSPFAYATVCAGALATALIAPPLKTQRDRHVLRRSLLPYAYIGPHLFFFVIFFVTPAVYGMYAAFTKWNLFNDPVWVGLDNFRTILLEQGNTYFKQLRNGLANTFKFVIFSVPFCILFPLSLAVALNARPRGRTFFQAVYYLPALMSITTVTLSWRYMFFKSYGVMNHFFMSAADWFVPPHSWIMLVVVTVWWVSGGTMVIYQSSLASIPTEHYEAASVDGANGWHKFLHVTLPGMRYPLTYTLVAAVVAQFNIYGQPLILTGFGNQEANAVLLMYVYENAVKKQVAGISAAMALILGFCIMAVSLVQLRLMRANAPD